MIIFTDCISVSAWHQVEYLRYSDTHYSDTRYSDKNYLVIHGRWRHLTPPKCHRAPTSVVRPFIRQWSTAICRETIQSGLSDCRVVYHATDRTQLTNCPGLRSRTPTTASRQPRTNQHVSRQQLGGRGICASSRTRPWLVSLRRGQNWAPRKPRIKIGTRGSPLTKTTNQTKSN